MKISTAVTAFVLAVMAASFVSWAPAAEDSPKSKKPASTEADEPVVTDMRVRTIKGSSFYHASYETTFDKIGEVAREAVQGIRKASDDKKIQVTGSIVFVYRGVTEDFAKPFKLEIGIEVAEGAKAEGDYKVRMLQDFKCASVLFQGPISKVMTAYQKLMPSLGEAGLKPADESREYYLHWEGEASPNNVMMLGVGFKEAP